MAIGAINSNAATASVVAKASGRFMPRNREMESEDFCIDASFVAPATRNAPDINVMQ